MFAAVVAALAAVNQAYLLGMLEWGDESETIVTVKMMAAGMRLYSEIFNHHGPLVFLPGFLIEHFGSFGVRVHRVPIALLQWAAVACLATSPLLSCVEVRKHYAVVAASVMLIFLPEMYGHTYQYQTIAGLLLVIILAQYTLPAIVCPDKVGKIRVACGSTLLAALPFLSVTYAPVAALLFLGAARRAHLRITALAVAASVAANVLFLLLTASLPGYLAFHFYLNSAILSSYDGGHGLPGLVASIYSALTDGISGFVALVILVAALVSAAARDAGKFPWRPLVLGAALAGLLIRTTHPVHQLAFYYACLALPLILVASIRLAWRPAALALVLPALCAVKLSLLVPADAFRLSSRQIADATEFSELARAVTGPGERIIAYSFRNYEYIAADRLPASGHFFYLPWQPAYEKAPRLGIDFAACAQIRAARPKIMLLDKWKVWNRYTWESYASCVDSIAEDSYWQVSGKPYYLRKDLPAADIGLAMLHEKLTLAETARASVTPLSFTKAHDAEEAALKTLRVRFADGTPAPSGGRLELGGLGGTETVAFAFGGTAKNQYHAFDVPPGTYKRGRIVVPEGSALRVWESRGADASHTCIIYDYVNGKRRFTPGCPLR